MGKGSARPWHGRGWALAFWKETSCREWDGLELSSPFLRLRVGDNYWCASLWDRANQRGHASSAVRYDRPSNARDGRRWPGDCGRRASRSDGFVKRIERQDPRGKKFVIVGTATDGTTPVGVVGRFSLENWFL